MENDKIKFFKKRLLEERESKLETIDLMDKNSGDRQEFSTELSLYDNHPADIGTEVFIQAQTNNLRGNEKVLLDKIDDALVKLESGEYGKCEDCNKYIDEERLDIIPFASKCIDCEKESSDNSIQGSQGYRPIDEDSWQAVDRYNRITGDPSYGTLDQMGVLTEDEDIGAVEEVEKISEEYYLSTLM